MLSPADYAAYSQATGRSYPQSDEEKANMYGEVRDFRRNQTKSDGSPNIAGTLAIGAAALGGIAGAGLLGRKLLANSRGARSRDIPKAERASGQRGAPGGGNNDLATLKGMQEEIQSAIPQATVNLPQKKAQPAQTAASNPVTDSIVQDNKQAAQTNPLIQSFTADNIQAGAESKAKSNLVTSGFKEFSQMADQIAGEEPRPQIVEKKITFQEASPAPATRSQQVAVQSAEQKAKNFAASAVDTMVEIQENREPIIKVQSVDALDTAGDQLDNKFESVVQRDTDSIFKGKEAVASELKFTAQDLLNSQLPMGEATDRIMAAASAGNETANMLLDPNVPTRQLAQMGVLGSSMKMDKASGRVEANPTYEIKGGASASMSDRPSKARKLVGASIDDEGASNYGDMYGSSDGEYLDLDTGAGVEGSSYLKETEGYKERTNKGQTFLAGKVQEMTGSVPQSSRQERVLDEFVPIRQVGGEESPGVLVNEADRSLRLQAGDKGTDINVTGSRLIGNFEAPEPTPFFQFDDEVGVLVSDEGYINPTIRGRGVKDLKTAQTIPLTGRYNPGDDRLATQPYMLFNTINTEAGEKSVKQPIYGPLLQTVRNEKGERRAVPTALSRTELSDVADRASAEFMDPSVQRAYLGATDPDYLASVDPSQPLVTRPFDRSGYVAMRLNEEAIMPDGMIRKGQSIELPVLSDPSAKHRFVSDISSGSYDSQQYGRTPFKKGAQAEPTGGTERKGLGGVNPMELEDASGYEGQVAFRTPRVEGGRSLTPAESRPVAAPSNPVATGMADTRAKLEQIKPSRVVYAPEPSPDSIDSYDVGSVMQQTMAQAGRRRGSRRS